MNLADYTKMDTQSGDRGDFIKFERTGETRYLRFCYTSGGEKIGSDIPMRRKKWDQTQNKYIYDTEDGSLTCVLECIEYNEDGSNPRRVRWERSAYFCQNTLIPMWKNYARIIDGVWKVTASNPGTLDAAYSLFPVMNADTIKYPIIEAEKKETTESKPAATTQPTEQPVEEEPKPRKKYWE